MAALDGLDLNLLLTLDALFAERSVTRTARRLRLAQPTVSIQLAKLRAFFGDPLLLPDARGMRLTTRAEALQAPLRAALDGLGQAAARATFGPATADTTWRVMAADYGEIVVLARVLARLRAEAPATRLAVMQTQAPNVARLLASGEIDLCVHTLEDAPPRLRSLRLFAERYVLAGRKDHPRLRRRPTLRQFLALEHVLMSPDGGGFAGPTDRALAAAGATRKVVLSVPHFSFALAAIASSDLVAMLPARLVVGRADLVWHEPPLDVAGYEFALLWHERTHRDPAQRWLRALIASLHDKAYSKDRAATTSVASASGAAKSKSPKIDGGSAGPTAG